MSSQETIQDDTLYQGYQHFSVVTDDTVHLASQPAGPAHASKQSGYMKKDEDPRECASRETRTASLINATHQPEENDDKVVDLLDQLNDLVEQQKYISSKVDEVVSRLQEALKQSTYRSLPKGSKLVIWADNASPHGPNDDTHRPGKRGRGCL